MCKRFHAIFEMPSSSPICFHLELSKSVQERQNAIDKLRRTIRHVRIIGACGELACVPSLWKMLAQVLTDHQRSMVVGVSRRPEVHIASACFDLPETVRPFSISECRDVLPHITYLKTKYVNTTIQFATALTKLHVSASMNDACIQSIIQSCLLLTDLYMSVRSSLLPLLGELAPRLRVLFLITHPSETPSDVYITFAQRLTHCTHLTINTDASMYMHAPAVEHVTCRSTTMEIAGDVVSTKLHTLSFHNAWFSESRLQNMTHQFQNNSSALRVLEFHECQFWNVNNWQHLAILSRLQELRLIDCAATHKTKLKTMYTRSQASIHENSKQSYTPTQSHFK